MGVKILLCLGALLLIQGKSVSQAGTVGYMGACTTAAADCDQAKLLVQCLKPYDSCSKGQCQCAGDKVYSNTDSKCIARDLVGQPCTSTAVHKATCTNSVVTCNQGTTNVGNVLCRDAKTKLLGEVCNATANEECFTYIADTYAGSGLCDGDVCGCSSGGIWEGTNCRQRVKGDMCIRSSECFSTQGCVGGYCGCIPGQQELSSTVGLFCYFPNDYGTGAVGSNCTAITDCTVGLNCALCPEHTYQTCRKIPLLPPGGSGTHLAPMLYITLSWVAALQGFKWFL